MGAVGTTRKNYKDFPKELKALSERMKLSNEFLWNSMVSQGVRHTEEGENVHAFIWLDNAQVLGLTTIHDIPTSIENYTVCNRKKPYNTHKVVKAVFGEHPRMLLPIP